MAQQLTLDQFIAQLERQTGKRLTSDERARASQYYRQRTQVTPPAQPTPQPRRDLARTNAAIRPSGSREDAGRRAVGAGPLPKADPNARVQPGQLGRGPGAFLRTMGINAGRDAVDMLKGVGYLGSMAGGQLYDTVRHPVTTAKSALDVKKQARIGGQFLGGIVNDYRKNYASGTKNLGKYAGEHPLFMAADLSAVGGLAARGAKAGRVARALEAADPTALAGRAAKKAIQKVAPKVKAKLPAPVRTAAGKVTAKVEGARVGRKAKSTLGTAMQKAQTTKQAMFRDLDRELKAVWGPLDERSREKVRLYAHGLLPKDTPLTKAERTAWEWHRKKGAEGASRLRAKGILNDAKEMRRRWIVRAADRTGKKAKDVTDADVAEAMRSYWGGGDGKPHGDLHDPTDPFSTPSTVRGGAAYQEAETPIPNKRSAANTPNKPKNVQPSKSKRGKVAQETREGQAAQAMGAEPGSVKGKNQPKQATAEGMDTLVGKVRGKQDAARAGKATEQAQPPVEAVPEAPTVKQPWEQSIDEYGHPQYSADFVMGVLRAKEGDAIGTLGDFIKGPKTRAIYNDVLDTPVMVVNRPVQKGKVQTLADDQVFRGALGTYKGKPTIFVSNADANAVIPTILEEGAHALRKAKGRPMAKVDVSDYDFDAYKALPEEVSAEQLVKYVQSIKEPTHRELVQQAIAEGKIQSHPDYPDLAPAPKTPESAPSAPPPSPEPPAPVAAQVEAPGGKGGAKKKGPKIGDMVREPDLNMTGRIVGEGDINGRPAWRLKMMNGEDGIWFKDQPDAFEYRATPKPRKGERGFAMVPGGTPELPDPGAPLPPELQGPSYLPLAPAGPARTGKILSPLEAQQGKKKTPFFERSVESAQGTYELDPEEAWRKYGYADANAQASEIVKRGVDELAEPLEPGVAPKPGYVPYDPDAFDAAIQGRSLKDANAGAGFGSGLAPDTLPDVDAIFPDAEVPSLRPRMQVPAAAKDRVVQYANTGPEYFGEMAPAVRAYDAVQNFWKESVLGLRPAWQVTNAVGDSLKMAIPMVDRGTFGVRGLFRAADPQWRNALPDEVTRGGFWPAERRVESEFGQSRLGRAIAKPGAIGFGMGQAGEAARRSLTYLDALPNGVTPSMVTNYGPLTPEMRGVRDAAIRHTNDVLGNYSGLTPFEQAVVRRALPFWAYTRETGRFLGKAPFEHPVGFAAEMAAGRQADRQNRAAWEPYLDGMPRENLPAWLQARTPLGPGAPDEDAGPTVRTLGAGGVNPFNPMTDIAERGPAGFLLSSLGPIPKTLLQYGAGKDFFTDTPYRLANVTEDGYTFDPTQPGLPARRATGLERRPLSLLWNIAARNFPQYRIAEQAAYPYREYDTSVPFRRQPVMRGTGATEQPVDTLLWQYMLGPSATDYDVRGLIGSEQDRKARAMGLHYRQRAAQEAQAQEAATNRQGLVLDGAKGLNPFNYIPIVDWVSPLVDPGYPEYAQDGFASAPGALTYRQRSPRPRQARTR